MHCTCLLLGVKRTCRFALQMSAFDPKRTSQQSNHLLASRIVTIWPGHVALQHLLTMYGFQAIALVLQKPPPVVI